LVLAGGVVIAELCGDAINAETMEQLQLQTTHQHDTHRRSA
jgi:hypothetical protein